MGNRSLRTNQFGRLAFARTEADLAVESRQFPDRDNPAGPPLPPRIAIGRFQKQEWAPATANRYRALISLTYRLAIRNGTAKENPARLVVHRHEDNARIRFLSAEEEKNLREAIEKLCPERMPEFDLALNTGVRLSEQYGLLWENVSIPFADAHDPA